MAKTENKRLRFNVPVNDEDVIAWCAAQNNLSLSLRMLIKTDIEKTGVIGDLFASHIVSPRSSGAAGVREVKTVSIVEDIAPSIVARPAGSVFTPVIEKAADKAKLVEISAAVKDVDESESALSENVADVTASAVEEEVVPETPVAQETVREMPKPAAKPQGAGIVMGLDALVTGSARAPALSDNKVEAEVVDTATFAIVDESPPSADKADIQALLDG